MNLVLSDLSRCSSALTSLLGAFARKDCTSGFNMLLSQSSQRSTSGFGFLLFCEVKYQTAELAENSWQSSFTISRVLPAVGNISKSSEIFCCSAAKRTLRPETQLIEVTSFIARMMKELCKVSNLSRPPLKKCLFRYFLLSNTLSLVVCSRQITQSCL